ncbi:MAG: TonB-dependent receptor [Bacteroidota bacterium]
MNKIITFVLFITFSLSAAAQDYSLSGTVKDEENTPLLGATVVVLDAVDSTMMAFGITDETGKFLVYDVPAGDRILQVSYTGYSDHSQMINVSGEQKEIQIGEIVLSVSSAILEEVSIKAEHIPMGILGDTINYNAAAFQTRPGASVEDLLKKLPGIEVARDGSLKAQGKDVENVLVDGKEFFSGDPTIATKNLEAEAVDKVQVYDKKSEEAEFTGIDDGQEEKTINLKLKDGYKNGGFGKASIDAGTEDTRQAKLNYNRFSPSVQASVIGNTNNINRQAFSFNEYVDFMGGFQNVLAAGGLNEYGVNVGSPQASQGIIDQKSIGSNLNVDFSKGLKLNANYLFGQNDTDLEQFGSTQNFADNKAFSTIDTSLSTNRTTNHRLNTILKYNPNPLNNFTLNTRFYRIGTSDISSSSADFLVDGTNQSMTSSATNTATTAYNLNTSLLYKKKFRKKGRNWITRASYEHSDREEETDINNTFLTDTEEELIKQFQSFTNRRNTRNGNTKYTEPIGKKVYLSMNYTFNQEMQTPIRDYFNRIENQLVLDNDISSTFESRWMFHDVGFSLKRNRKKLNLTMALNYRNAGLRAWENGLQVNDNEDYQYFLPSLSASYKMKSSKTIEFGYSSSVNAPQLSQMVTQINNLNPNFLILGNPNLSPEYIHRYSLNYSAFDQFNFSNQFANLSVTYSPNRIVNSRNLRSDLVTEVIPVNAGNHMAARLYFSHQSPIRKLKIKYSISTSMMYSRYNTFVNDLENNVNNANANVNFSIENRNKDVVDIAGGLRLDASAFSNSFNSNFDEPFVNYSWYLDGFVILGKGFNLGATYDYRTFNNAFFQGEQVAHLLGATFSKSFLNDKLTLTITAHDLLNQNIGIDRSGTINSLSDSRYNTLGRYVMFGASYRIGMVRKSGIDFKA